MLRVDFTAPFKYPFFNPPSSVVDFRNPQTFVRSRPTRGFSASARDGDDGDLPTEFSGRKFVLWDLAERGSEPGSDLQFGGHGYKIVGFLLESP